MWSPPDGSGGWYLGGNFTAVRGQPRMYLAALDAATGAATAWDAHADDYVFALAVSGGTVYAGGLFTNIGGQRRNLIAALDAARAAATAPEPGADNPVGGPAGSGGTVYARRRLPRP